MVSVLNTAGETLYWPSGASRVRLEAWGGGAAGGAGGCDGSGIVASGGTAGGGGAYVPIDLSDSFFTASTALVHTPGATVTGPSGRSTVGRGGDGSGGNTTVITNGGNAVLRAYGGGGGYSGNSSGGTKLGLGGGGGLNSSQGHGAAFAGGAGLGGNGTARSSTASHVWRWCSTPSSLCCSSARGR